MHRRGFLRNQSSQLPNAFAVVNAIYWIKWKLQWTLQHLMHKMGTGRFSIATHFLNEWKCGENLLFIFRLQTASCRCSFKFGRKMNAWSSWPDHPRYGGGDGHFDFRNAVWSFGYVACQGISVTYETHLVVTVNQIVQGWLWSSNVFKCDMLTFSQFDGCRALIGVVLR